MTNQEEQKLVECLIVNLSCFLHHKRTLHFMRSTLLDVSSQYVQNATFTLGLMEGTFEHAKSEIHKLLPLMEEIIASDGLIRGSDYSGSSHNRNKSLHFSSKICVNCGITFSSTSTKQRFCTPKCRTANHRKTKEARNNQYKPDNEVKMK